MLYILLGTYYLLGTISICYLFYQHPEYRQFDINDIKGDIDSYLTEEHF